MKYAGVILIACVVGASAVTTVTHMRLQRALHERFAVVRNAAVDAHLRAKRATDATMLRKLLSTINDDSNSNSPFCLFNCLTEFERKSGMTPEVMDETAKPTGDEVDLQERGLAQPNLDVKGFFGRNAQNHSMVEALPVTCELFQEAELCMAGCQSNVIFQQMVARALKPLEFMCIEKYADFKMYAPCYDAAEEPSDCESTCGGEDYVEQKQKEMEMFAATNNLKGMLGNVGNLCNFLQCNIDCIAPTLQRSCGTEESSMLFRQFVGHMVSGLTDTFTENGLDILVPGECSVITKVVDKGMPTALLGNEQAMKMALMEKQMKVLDKEEKKLALEMQVLEMKRDAPVSV